MKKKFVVPLSDAITGVLHGGAGTFRVLIDEETSGAKHFSFLVNTSNAGNPMTDGKTPLLTIDVWEHAYYIDYRNARPKYLDEIWKLVNWDFVAANYG